jgi:hypothetical protein
MYAAKAKQTHAIVRMIDAAGRRDNMHGRHGMWCIIC